MCIHQNSPSTRKQWLGLIFEHPTISWYSQSNLSLLFLCYAGIIISLIPLFDFIIVPLLSSSPLYIPETFAVILVQSTWWMQLILTWSLMIDLGSFFRCVPVHRKKPPFFLWPRLTRKKQAGSLRGSKKGKCRPAKKTVNRTLHVHVHCYSACGPYNSKQVLLFFKWNL